MATSVGGVLTGRGADVILIDDPMKPADAMSESRRAAANDWFDSTLYSRLNDKEKGAIVIVMQRLHEDDLAGHVLRARAAGTSSRSPRSRKRTRRMSSRRRPADADRSARARAKR